MTIADCAALVERGDPDRFLAVMAAPVHARAKLLPLYAFNLEVARAPWVTEEPLIAEMRLQWWRDVVENAASGAVRAHEVAGPLHALIREQKLPVEVLDRLIAARRWDIHRERHADLAALEIYLEETGAGLMWLAALALDAPATAEGPIRAYGWATAAANYLRAGPALAVRGRHPLPEGVNAVDLARLGLDRLTTARAGRAHVVAEIKPALLAGWQATPILRRALSAGSADIEGLSEFQRRGRLVWQAFSGRW